MSRFKLDFRIKQTFEDDIAPVKYRFKSDAESFEESDLEYLLEEFKHFLLAAGYPSVTVSRLQYLNDDEWKYVLTNYGEWDEVKENLYKHFKRLENGEN